VGAAEKGIGGEGGETEAQTLGFLHFRVCNPGTESLKALLNLSKTLNLQIPNIDYRDRFYSL
jgi:hypothetical protein